MNKEEAKKIFGENLRRIRQAKGVTQDELAKALGYINRSSINKIETGRSDMPRSKIEQAARILGVSPLELFKNEPLESDAILDTEVDQVLLSITKDFDKLNDTNRMKLSVYFQALMDSQEAIDDTHTTAAKVESTKKKMGTETSGR